MKKSNPYTKGYLYSILNADSLLILCFALNMNHTATLLLNRGESAMLLPMDECIEAVERAFARHAEGKMIPPKVMGVHSEKGGFHIKAGISASEKAYFVSKMNANFPDNSTLYGLPTIQGVIMVCDGNNGSLLALIDSIEITTRRTGAATAVAAKYLALENAGICTICGCGNQGRISVEALSKVRKIEKVYAFDIDHLKAENFASELESEVEVIPISAAYLPTALGRSQICVTCTPSKHPYIHARDIMPGTFIAAVGADSEEKQELHTDLFASGKIVVDIKEQSASFGELHHALDQGLINITAVHAELGQIITGQKPGRESDKEIIIFDSTGTALQDVVAAAIVYEKAVINGMGTSYNFL